MDLKELLKKQAAEVHDLLSIYIKIHDTIFKKSATFLSLFKRVDFQDIFNQTEKLIDLFSDKLQELHEIDSNIDESVPIEYRQYYDQLVNFFEKLCDTISLLNDRQYRLLLKSKGEKYSMKEFMNIEKQYNLSVDIYMEEGDKLNNINYLVFN